MLQLLPVELADAGQDGLRLADVHVVGGRQNNLLDSVDVLQLLPVKAADAGNDDDSYSSAFSIRA